MVNSRQKALPGGRGQEANVPGRNSSTIAIHSVPGDIASLPSAGRHSHRKKWGMIPGHLEIAGNLMRFEEK